MAKAKKSEVDSGRKQVDAENVDDVEIPGGQRTDFIVLDDPQRSVMPFPPGVEFVPERDMLFDLYVARVAKAETVQTVRRDGKAIFRDAYFEAKCALDVYQEMTAKR